MNAIPQSPHLVLRTLTDRRPCPSRSEWPNLASSFPDRSIMSSRRTPRSGPCSGTTCLANVLPQNRNAIRFRQLCFKNLPHLDISDMNPFIHTAGIVLAAWLFAHYSGIETTSFKTRLKISFFLLFIGLLAFIALGIYIAKDKEAHPDLYNADKIINQDHTKRPNKADTRPFDPAPLKRGSIIVITEPTNLYFYNQVYRVAKTGEEFEVYEYRPNEKRLYILSKDSKGNPIGLNIPDQ